MLISDQSFTLLVLACLLVVLGPAIGGIVAIRRHADWFRSLSALRQLSLPIALVAWVFTSGVPLLNYRAWLNVANAWVIRSTETGIVKEDARLIGAARYRFVNGKDTTLRAVGHYSLIINDTAVPVKMTSAFYGECPPDSPQTLAAVLSMEADSDIPSGTVAYNRSLDRFGHTAEGRPKEITIIRGRYDMTDPCERISWYFPVTGEEGGIGAHQAINDEEGRQ